MIITPVDAAGSVVESHGELVVTYENNWHYRYCLPWANADVLPDPSDGSAMWIGVEDDERGLTDDPLVRLRLPTSET